MPRKKDRIHLNVQRGLLSIAWCMFGSQGACLFIGRDATGKYFTFKRSKGSQVNGTMYRDRSRLQIMEYAASIYSFNHVKISKACLTRLALGAA